MNISITRTKLFSTSTNLCSAIVVCLCLSACSSRVGYSTLTPWGKPAQSPVTMSQSIDELETISINQASDDALPLPENSAPLEMPLEMPLEIEPDTIALSSATELVTESMADNVLYPTYKTQFTYTQVDAYINRLFMTLQDNAPTNLAIKSIAVVNFVKFDQALTNVTLLGQHITEHLMQEGQRVGYQIIEHKVTNRILQSSKGDTVFDYYLSHHAHNFDAVLTGTIIPGPTGLSVHARIVDVTSQTILSSANVFIPRFIVDQLPHREQTS